MMRLHPGNLCVAFCIGCWRRWRAWLCARDARKTLRSSCFATNSQSCAGRTPDQRSPMRTGPCSAPSRRRCPDRGELAGSLHPTPCCAGIDAASPATGLNPPDQQAARPQPPRTANSCSRWPARTRHGVTAASPANSPGSACGSEHRQCGESSNAPCPQPSPPKRPATNRSPPTPHREPRAGQSQHAETRDPKAKTRAAAGGHIWALSSIFHSSAEKSPGLPPPSLRNP